MDKNTIYRILIIDNDYEYAEILKDYLESVGYEVDFTRSIEDGMRRALAGGYHAIMLDIVIPGMDGLEVLKELHIKCKTPILVISHRADETERIIGLEIGADDYFPKHFTLRSILARLRALLRRSSYHVCHLEHVQDMGAIAIENALTAGTLQLNEAKRQVSLDQAPVSLTAIEFDLLTILLKSSGRVLSRDHLLDAVAGRSHDVFDRSIDVHISSLRKKLGDNPRNPKYIKTIRSVGYQFVA